MDEDPAGVLALVARLLPKEHVHEARESLATALRRIADDRAFEREGSPVLGLSLVVEVSGPGPAMRPVHVGESDNLAKSDT
jgi:hypothetical protein